MNNASKSWAPVTLYFYRQSTERESSRRPFHRINFKLVTCFVLRMDGCIFALSVCVSCCVLMLFSLRMNVKWKSKILKRKYASDYTHEIAQLLWCVLSLFERLWCEFTQKPHPTLRICFRQIFCFTCKKYLQFLRMMIIFSKNTLQKHPNCVADFQQQLRNILGH